jgi:hypothetical protein
MDRSTKTPKVETKIGALIDKWAMVHGRSELAHHVFNGGSSFSALNNAVAFVQRRGHSLGSLDAPNPIGFAVGECYVGKWHTIGREHYGALGGVILSEDFRFGPCVVVKFKK